MAPLKKTILITVCTLVCLWTTNKAENVNGDDGNKAENVNGDDGNKAENVNGDDGELFFGPLQDKLETPPCPNYTMIHPCHCKVNADKSMNMNCSTASEQRIHNIFNLEIPAMEFERLIIENNDILTELRAGDFGNSSFRDIEIKKSAITVIEDKALEGSFGNLVNLTLNHNAKLTTFPNVSLFERLENLDYRYNAKMDFPVLQSSTLRVLELHGNNWDTIPLDAITDLPVIEIVHLSQNNIKEVQEGTFTNNKHLHEVRLGYNEIIRIPNNTITLHGEKSVLDLSYNKIADIELMSFAGVTGLLNAKDNILLALDEKVWRPLLENEVEVLLGGNPFDCGCDVAWLILNQTLLDRVRDKPTCYEGTPLVDLDPSWYETNC